MKRLAAELFGTFVLVFAGTGAIVIDSQQDAATITHVGVALTFGLIVMAMIYAIGDVSGAHINPAVTIGFWVARRFPGRSVPAYIACQCAGALAASGLLLVLFPDTTTLGATLPGKPQWLWQSFVFEIVLTSILMFVILSVSTGAKEKGVMAGVAIGAVVALAALFAGPVSGASMNPARSLGPAVVSGNVTHLWLYVVAPIIGAVAAVATCRCVQDEPCCRSASCSAS
jgi:aquaporin Z